MKTKIIFFAMAMMLYAISGSAQIPNATINVAGHPMVPSTWDQFMPAIAIDKTKAPAILVSFTSTHHGDCAPPYDNYQAYYYSPSGANPCTTCLGDPTGLPSIGTQHPESHGFPSVCFDNNGLGYMMGGNGDGTGFFALATPDDGATWVSGASNTHITAAGSCINIASAVDELSTSPNAGNYYVMSAQFPNSDYGTELQYAVKTPSSGSFGSSTVYGNNVGTNFDLDGPALAVGPDPDGTNDGVLYACWAIVDGPSGQPSWVGTSCSTDGGSTFTNLNQFQYLGIGYGYVDDLNYAGTYVNGFPSIAVDKSCGPHRGTIYIAAAEQIIDPNNQVYQQNVIGSIISIWYSNDKGLHWGGGYNVPIVNPNFPNSGTPISISAPSGQGFCWFPSIAVDDLTGVVSVVYYGYPDKNHSNLTNTYVSYCDPSDPTNPSNWQSIKVSTSTQTPEDYSQVSCNHYPFTLANDKPNEGNSIASYGGHAYPVWKDRSSGLRQIWIADVLYDVTPLASSASSLQICPSASSTSSSPDIRQTENYDASTFIDVATCGSGVLSIGSSTDVVTVNMKAGQYIQIGQGFVTAPGSVFTAEIGSNGGCQTPGVRPFSHHSPEDPASSVPATPTDINGLKVFAYPNPTNDFITVGISNNNYQNVSFSVTDLSGRSIAQYTNASLSGSGISQIIDASSYAAGLYIVTMTADNQKYSFKFAKE